MGKSKIPWALLILTILLNALALFFVIELNFSTLAFLIIIGCSIGLWKSTISLIINDEKSGAIQNETARNQIKNATYISVVGVLFFVIIYFLFAGNSYEKNKKRECIKKFALNNIEKMLALDNYGINFQIDFKNTQTEFFYNNLPSKTMIDMSESFFNLIQEKKGLVNDVFEYNGLEDAVDLIRLLSDIEILYKNKLFAIHQIVIYTEGYAKEPRSMLNDSVFYYAEEYDNKEKQIKTITDSFLTLIDVNPDSIYKLYNKKQETIPVEALSVYAIVSKVCNGFFKYREYFSYKKVSNTESSYYDGRGRYNLTGITFLIKKELPFNVRSINNQCTYVLTKNHDRVITMKEACYALCKDDIIDNGENSHYEIKVPEDRIIVNGK